jgi:hypothetical protein
VVAGLTVGGVVKGDGLYTSASGFITGSGKLRVGAVPTGYGLWLESFPFDTGVNDGPDQDADGDGIKNLLEYVFGGIPVGPGSADLATILPVATMQPNDIKLSFRRSDLSEADTTLKVQWSTDLAIWNDLVTIGAGDALPTVDITEDSPTAELDTVDVLIPRSHEFNGRLYGRVVATKP